MKTKTLLTALILLLLAACASKQSPIELTLEVSTTPSATRTPRPSIAPPPSNTLPRPPTPAFSETDLQGSLLFTDCELPCWHGLVPGQSDVSDVLAVFVDSLGFDEDYDLLLHNRASGFLPDAYSIHNHWTIDLDDGAGITVNAEMDEKSSTLLYLSLHWTYNAYIQHLNIPHLVERLGEPSSIYISIVETQAPDFGIAHLLLFYEQGVSIELYQGVRIENDRMTLCFADTGAQGNIQLVPPPAQNETLVDHPVVSAALQSRDYLPMSEGFGITEETLVAELVQQSDLCITASVQ